jgi:uncharacterized alpha-E superfamily protein
MTRDDGWRLLTTGRQIERLLALSSTLAIVFESGAIAHDDGFDLTLALFDSAITYRSLYQRRLEMPPLLDLLVLDIANPRALARMVRFIRRELLRLPGKDHEALRALLPEQETWPTLATLCQRDGDGTHGELIALTRRLAQGAQALSDAVGERYFSHAVEAYRILSA